MEFNGKEKLKAYLSLLPKIDINNADKIIKDLFSEKDSWEQAKDFADPFLNEIYSAIGICYIEKKDYKEAEKYFSLALEAIEKRFPEYGYVQKRDIYENFFLLYSITREKEKAVNAKRNAIFYELKTISNTHYPNFSFYTFRNAKSFAIADLRDSKISFSSLFDFNDPVDSAYFECSKKYLTGIHDPIQKMRNEIEYQVFSELRAKCFITSKHLPNHQNLKPTSIDVEPFFNTLMWAHYADYHNGYCAMYKFPHDATIIPDADGYVLYTSEINYSDEMQYPTSMNFKDGFLTKSKRWEYEHEKRILYFQQNKGVKDHPEVHVPIDCLKEVYIGLRCEKEYEIYEALRDKPNVKVFRMKISEDDIFSLDCEEIDRKNWNPKKPLDDSSKEKCAIRRVYECLKRSIKNDCKGL